MAQLTLVVLLHALLGLGLAALVWAVGVGVARLLSLEPLFGYAPGLLVVTAAAFLVLVTPWLVAVSALLVVGPVVLAWRERAPDAGPALRALARTAPAALGLGVALGLLNHGPTEDLDSSAYSDMLVYAAKVVSAAQSLFPFRDLLVEGFDQVWVETAWILLGGAFESTVGLDEILFQAAASPAFLLGAVAVGAGLLPRQESSPLLPLVAVLATASVAYPTYLTESPPLAIALPLAFPLYALWLKPVTTGRFALVCALVAVCFFLTKGFGLIPFAVVAGAVLMRDHRPDALRAVAAVVVVAVAAGVVFATTSDWLLEVLELKFLPADAVEGVVDQLDHRDTQALAPGLQVGGQVLLAVALWRSRAWTFLGVLLAAVAGNWLLAGHGFDIAVGLALLLAAIYFSGHVDQLELNAPVLAAAGAALLASVWFRDITGVRAAFLLTALLALGLLLALVPAPSFRLTAAAVALVAVGALLGFGDRATTLTPEHRDIWLKVRETVPRDNGIVFTTETGPVVVGDQGWNYYPGIAARQIYLAGWSSSPLLVDDDERAERLELNRRVLSGELDPDTLELSRDYGSRYAVVERGSDVGGDFRRLYANDRFELYRIP